MTKYNFYSKLVFKISLCLFTFCLCMYLISVWRSRNASRKVRYPSLELPYFENRMLSPSLSVNASDVLRFQKQSTEFFEEISKKYGDIRSLDVIPVNTTLTPEEERRMKVCIRNGPRDLKTNGTKFWGNNEHIRRTHHTYLNKEGSVLIEVGGNQGNDASEFVRLYSPRYLILEPLEHYANLLKKKFETNRRITVINLGLGVKNEIVMVTMDGNNACATSKYAYRSTSGDPNVMVPLYLINATEFLTKIGVGFFDVDLITINCEGCEFEVLETLLSSNLIRHFRNVQFATHTKLEGLPDPVGRYCRIQEVLSRTHRPTYQYRFTWESWRRKEFLFE